MENQIKELSVYGKKVAITKNFKDIEFISFSMFNKKGEYVNVKFTRDVTELPVEGGYYLVKVNVEDMNYTPAKPTKNEEDYSAPTLWIRKVVSIEKDTKAQVSAQERRAKKLNDLF